MRFWEEHLMFDRERRERAQLLTPAKLMYLLHDDIQGCGVTEHSKSPKQVRLHHSGTLQANIAIPMPE